MPIFKLFLDICLFRKGPQDIPLSRFLLVLTLVFTLSTSMLLSWVEVEFFQAILQSVCATLLLVGFFFGMLRMAGKITRFPQTLIAALAADGMITALAIPLVFVSVALPEWQAAVSLLLLAMMLWELAVLGHIIQQAMDFPRYGPGFAMAFVYTVLSMRIMMGLFPALT
jgi:hypothetical protein